MDEEHQELTLPTPNTFASFPYSQPYAIQTELMRHVYEGVERKGVRVVLVESPTGTGKTLSLLCSTLGWLVDDKDRRMKGEIGALEQTLRGGDEPEWVLDQTVARFRREMEDREREMAERLERARRREEEMRKQSGAVAMRKRQKVECEEVEEGDDVFLPEDEEGVDDGTGDGLSPAVKALMKRLEDSRNRDEASEQEGQACTKVFYASRTHSQLSQLRSELLKTAHSTSRVVPLASRKNLCINEELRAKGDNVTNLDEGCRELLSEKKGKRCPYLPPPDEEHRILDFRDRVLATPRDIEDLVTIGKEMHTCPYFGSRRAIPQAELVALPYNLLLQKSAREALGINLKGNVVVIDEAHNLIDTILSIHTVTLSSHILTTSIQQLSIYLTRFRTRLTPLHGLHLRRLLRFLHALSGFLDGWKTGGNQTQEVVMQASDLMVRLGKHVEGVNLLEIERYLRSSKVARKVSGYSDKATERDAGKDPSQAARSRRRVTPPLHAVEAFILALTQSDADGRLILSRGDPAGDTVAVKYQLLNPGNHFKEIVDSARSVVLAGGTMSPIDDFRVQLFPSLKEDEVSVFSCGHVVPRENLQTLVIGKGPRGGELQFTYDRRGDQEMLAELGQVLVNLANIVPHGVVVFFPSYALLNTVKTTFRKNGTFDRLEAKKKVFFEPENTAEVDNVLRHYALAISSESPSPTGRKCGAMLFAVVGAKLSEGINFADSLARAVIVVGLPFPSHTSTELRERMRHVEEVEKASGAARRPGAKNAGAELYENLCMRSVNQSIGRAIRHKADYASLILVDTRYGSPGIRNKLPQWIGRDVVMTKSFGQAVMEIAKFFRTKR